MQRKRAHSKYQNTKLLSFNIEGLKPKLDDPNFLEFIIDYDSSLVKHGK